MSGDADDLQELVNDFVTESREHLRTVESDLLRLEQGGSDAETVNNVFRCVHSVKGVAGFLGLDRIQSLAHTLESTLDLVRKERLQPTADLVGALLAAIDGLREMIENVSASNEVDITAHTTVLQSFLQPTAPGTASPPTAAAPAAAAPAAAPAPAAAEPAAAVEARQTDDEADRTPAKKEPVAHSESQAAESIRVSVPLLNRLMTLSGEMVLGRNQVLQTLASDNQKALLQATANLSQVVSEMQEAIMQTRLQPVANVFQKLPRVVRDLTAKLGKRCRLVIEGKEVELDRSILEALGDPLTHLVRNAIDHGIERPEARKSAGKAIEGTLTLTAFHQGGNVKIEIHDDGAGIDPEKLRRKALEKGVISADQARTMSDRDATLLIFAPGFSTAEKLSDVSGRGVGMDVVRSNIEKLGGHVEVASEVGRGTTMTITIPLTLAIMPALVVTCSERRYVLPQNNVTELVRVRAGDGEQRLTTLQGRDVLRLRGQLLPVVHLRDALQVQDSRDARAARTHNIMVVQSGALRYGLVVDSPPDTEEIVVKPLGSHLKGRNEYSGSTILGDGRVALILDVAGLAASANLRLQDETEANADAAGAVARTGEEPTELVLFRNHAEELFAVPLGLVSRIQRLPTEEISTIGAQIVHRTTDRATPLLKLEDHLQARAPETLGNRWSVLVLRVQGREFGLVTSMIEDIKSLVVHVDDRTLASPGVIGSFQLGANTVRLLDVAALAHTALPQLFADLRPEPKPVARVATAATVAATPATPAAAAAATPRPPRVLFAEDSQFFRNHAARILRDGGIEVVTAEDGDVAWKILGDESQDFDLVLTDVQMPNCDGLELTRRIRASRRHATKPVVALTSLSNEDDIAQGMAAGVNQYLVKLDDAALLAAVRELVGAKS
ncbi:MAG: chemotaxis protein CheW [Planctomycetes bacterium]|nr:chemotaxis protein CheW [Planctomycetota bacterium]